jgi:hypothetical protein
MMLLVLLACCWLAVPGCQDTDKGSQLDEQCAQIIADLTACYPDLELDGECTEETVQLYEYHNVAELECTDVDDIGKADLFAFGGCGEGEHVCAYIFCCDDYVVTQMPEAIDYDIETLIEDYQALLPSQVAEERAGLSRTELVEGRAWTWEQDLADRVDAPLKTMAVELSVQLIEVPYSDFVDRLAPATWGINLAYYLGGQLLVIEEDQGLAVKQVERMVLSPFECDMDTRLGNMDMTKTEVIRYYSGRAKVYWRVYHSDNNSTEADVGSVEFSQYDEFSTLVTFHSAHRLNAPLGIHISNDLVQVTLQTYFLEHIRHYADLVGSPQS